MMLGQPHPVDRHDRGRPTRPICAVDDATDSDPSAANQASISWSAQNRPMSSTLS